MTKQSDPGALTRFWSFTRGLAPAACLVALEVARPAAERLGIHLPNLHDQPLWALAGFVSAVQYLHHRLAVHAGVTAGAEVSRKTAEELREDADSDRLYNEHLAAAVGTTIADILREIPKDKIAPLDCDAVGKMIKCGPRAFIRAVETGLRAVELDDAKLPALIEKAVQGQFEQWGKLGMWKALLIVMHREAMSVPGDSSDSEPAPLADASVQTAAEACRADFIRRFFNTIKTDLEHKGAAFASIHLRMMGELTEMGREGLRQHKLTQDKLDALVNRFSPVTREIAEKLPQEVRLALLPDIEQISKELGDTLFSLWNKADDVHVAVLSSAAESKARDDKLLAELKEVRKLLESKPTPAAPDQPPPVDPRIEALARRVAENPAATLVERVEAAIVSRSPEALSELDRLDSMVEFADFRRRQLRGDYHYFRGDYDEAAECYESSLALRPDDLRARNDVAAAHMFARLGDVGAHCQRAIDVCEGTLKLVAPGSEEWAKAQNNLGIAWADKPTGGKGENLDNAIAAFETALTVRTKERFPADWAGTQNNLGGAWANKPTGDFGRNIDNAIAAYTAALTVYTKERFPADWARTQNNLGAAWRNKPTGDFGRNIDNAIAAYTAALTVLTKERFPADWAATQNNLGSAWQNKPRGGLWAQHRQRHRGLHGGADGPHERALPRRLGQDAEQPGRRVAEQAERRSARQSQARCGLLRSGALRLDDDSVSSLPRYRERESRSRS